METGGKIIDIKIGYDLKIIECTFTSKDERDIFYTLAETQLVNIGGVLKLGPFFTDDPNVVSIAYSLENKDSIIEFINQYS